MKAPAGNVKDFSHYFGKDISTKIDEQEILMSDMSLCQPATALSKKLEKEHRQLIIYETEEVSGTMVGTASFIKVSDLTLPLNLSGWHAIYVGYWNPHHVYDYGATVKVKLSDDPCFIALENQTLKEARRMAWQNTYRRRP